MENSKAPSGVRKFKKKQAKDELDRIKQAEKKKRRLEKALAASAAIISELEKKNQKKKEEQQRLDEECAEAVSLQVLIGEESDKSCVQAMMHKEEEWCPWGYCARNLELFVGDSHARTTATIIPHSHLPGSPNGDAGWVSDGCGGSGYQRNGHGYFFQAPYVMEIDWEASEAISSIHITDDGVNAFVFN